MATMNLNFYRGTDSYSDGDIEDKILELAREHVQIEDMDPEQVPYPVLYHLSKVRENILNWYPFKENASVLEIGSGCGAITGLLCRKAAVVTSVELSKRRATINYERNKECDNLTIMVGNLNEMEFPQKYDYVILNGVFEYAASFTEGEHPYETFLNSIKEKLASDGRILIAIENRMGIKYLSGSSEDHTGMHYLGMNQYENVNSVRTFSRTEMEALMKSCGLPHYQFYYPYPDYKFPYEIFTDSSINSAEYGRNMFQFEEDRLGLFNNHTMISSLANDGIAQFFANSFLVEMSAQELEQNKNIEYVKLNSDRKKDYEIITSIYETEGSKYVDKEALTTEAKAHIKNLYENNGFKKEGSYTAIQGRMSADESCVTYDYIKGENLNDILSEKILAHDVDSVCKALRDILQTFFADTTVCSDYQDQKFTEIFGTEQLQGERACVMSPNIDLICDNIYPAKNGYQVIDCEWILKGVRVPVAFIMWRVINELYHKNNELYSMLDRRALENEFDIHEDDANVFLAWAISFANKYVGSYALEQYAKPVMNISLDQIARDQRSRYYMDGCLYYDLGNGYSEEQTQKVSVLLKDGTFSIHFDLDQNAKYSRLRWDPQECSCMVEVEAVECNLGKLKATAINAISKDVQNMLDNKKQADWKGQIFAGNDPYYELTFEDGSEQLDLTGINSVTIKGKIKVLEQAEAKRVFEAQVLHDSQVLDEQLEVNRQQVAKNDNLMYENTVKSNELIRKEEENTQLQETVTRMINSPSWKITAGLRKVRRYAQRCRNFFKKKPNPIHYAIDWSRWDGSQYSVYGWMFDDRLEHDVKDIKIVLKRMKKVESIPVRTGLYREDIAAAYGDEKLANCGFALDASVGNLKRVKVYLQYEMSGQTKQVYIDTIGQNLKQNLARHADNIRRSGFESYWKYLTPSGMSAYIKRRKAASLTSTQLDVVLPNLQEAVAQVWGTDIAESAKNIESAGKNIQAAGQNSQNSQNNQNDEQWMNQTIDIIIPVYNGMAYLERLFETVEHTKMPHRLIVVNDCSPDERIKPFLENLAKQCSHMILLENEKNMGFLPSVNRAMSMAEHDIALVNTDTEQPDGWLERLMRPILTDPEVASSTPYTNSGTICSFPEFGINNLLFDGLSVNEVDELFHDVKPAYQAMPTGVGFCMGMSLAALKKVGLFDEASFGKGYAEENDWCQRAIQAGYKNVQVENLYVYHKHGGSFLSDEKEKLLAEHSKTLAKKHPNYDEDVIKFCQSDPNKNVRNLVLMKYYSKNEKTILAFDHNLGGGATSYLNRRIELENSAGNTVIVVRYDYAANCYMFLFNQKDYQFRYQFEKFEELEQYIRIFSVDEILINELVTYPDLYEKLKEIVAYKNRYQCKLTMLMHDFFSICPSINLLIDWKQYCGIGQCEQCSEGQKAEGGMNSWRENWKAFFLSCDEIQVFSKDSEAHLKKAYGELDNIVLNPHKVQYMPKLQKELKLEKTLNIGIIGTLTEHKGLEHVRNMAAYIDEKKLPVKIKLIGYIDSGEGIEQDSFEELGRYATGELPRLVIENDIDIFFIPSIWPETFSYTSEEVMQMNMPIASFNMGAPAERIAQYQKGIIIDRMDAAYALDCIVAYMKEKNFYKTKDKVKKILCVTEYVSFSSRYRLEHMREEMFYQGIASDFVETKDIDETYEEKMQNEYDALLIYRSQLKEPLTKLVTICKNAGKHVCYDIDDYIFDYNKIKDLPFMQEKEYKNFAPYSARINQCMNQSDVIFTSTETMKKVILEAFPDKKVVVNRNVASGEMLVQSLKAKEVRDIRKQSDRVIMGYFSGSKTHDSDFALIEDDLLKLMAEHDNLYLHTVGVLKLSKEFDRYTERLIHTDFVDWRNLPGLISSVDINLMPLENTEFHCCKSENKWMEAGLVGVPTIASYNKEIAGCIKQEEDGILFENSDEFMNSMEKLITNHEYRKAIGDQAFETVLKRKLTLNVPDLEEEYF